MITLVYDDIAVDYKNSKELPFRTYIESYTLFQLTGSLDGKEVIDLACGEGFYTRKIKMAGADSVIGVDISSEMIQLARENEADLPRGCDYEVYNVAEMPTMGTFDLVTAMYLLNYAQTREELLKFCRAAYRQLKAGGRFVGVNDNPFNDPKQYATYRPYGFIKRAWGQNRNEGAPIRYTFFNADGSQFQFNNYYLHPATYEAVFREAGFSSFEWVPVSLDPVQNGNSFWHPFLEHPPIIGFVAEV